MPLSQFDERVPISSYNTLSSGVGPVGQTLINGATYGTRVDQFIVTWNGAAPFEIDVQVTDGFGDLAMLGTVTIPAPTGTERSAVDVIGALLPLIQPFIILPPTAGLVVFIKVAITGAEEFTAWTSGGNF